MKIKVNLHTHTKEDALDGHFIKYNIFELIERAKKLGFGAIAWTGHNKLLIRKEHIAYAQKRGILLIPGIELSLDRRFLKSRHVVVLNCEASVEKIKTFEELREYKKNHHKIFVFAPHPDFGFYESIGLEKLIKYIDVFDAIEHSWFYSRKFNLNRVPAVVARAYKKPFIATSDAHVFNYLNSDYLIVKTDKKDIISIFKAIKKNNFTNITSPKKLTTLVWYFIKIFTKDIFLMPAI